MKQILNILSLLLLISCSSIDKSTPDFYIIHTYYDQKKIDRSETFYNSKSGVLRLERPEEVIIKLSDDDKKEIVNFYNSLKKPMNTCWYTYEDGSSANFKFIIKKTDFKEVKCDSTKKDQVNEVRKIYFKIIKTLQSKKEYREAFPGEFEIL